MKLSQYAKKLGVHYKTAWRWYKEGRLEGYQLPTGTIIITEEDTPEKDLEVAVYARVSSSDGRKNLEAQAERLTGYCMAKDWRISRIVKEIGSGVSARLYGWRRAKRKTEKIVAELQKNGEKDSAADSTQDKPAS